jgi:hypothetical protein
VDADTLGAGLGHAPRSLVSHDGRQVRETFQALSLSSIEIFDPRGAPMSSGFICASATPDTQVEAANELVKKDAATFIRLRR